MARQKIAVLGGGVGAMTAAFHLTSIPGWRERYEVTVYQLGWRLGGKCASGRNRDHADRIEQHSLAMFLGFFDNAFALMQRLYGELGRHPDAPLARWDQAWQPRSYFVLEEDLGDHVEHWPFNFPANGAVPGHGAELPTPWQMLQVILGWAKHLFENTNGAPAPAPVTEEHLGDIVSHAATSIASAAGAPPIVSDLIRLLRSVIGVFAGVSETLIVNTFLHAAEHHVRRQPTDANQHHRHDHVVICWLLREFMAWLKRHWLDDARARTATRRPAILLDILVATAIGMLQDELIATPVDWFKIDELCLEDWLVKHGAHRTSVDSAPILLLRELASARRGGVGAGTALHYALRMLLTYKGAFAFQMQAGVGDTVFAPFYQVLARRGVRFEFFQAVEELGTGRDEDGKPVIDRIAIGVQAETRGGAAYRPLIDVGGLPCWPSQPLHEQLVQGEELRRSGENLENWWSRWPAVRTRELRRGVDFDQVVLGISVGAYPYLCQQLIAETPAFAQMVEAVQVTETQAAQLWLRPDYAIMGWPLGPRPLIGTYREPFDTVTDMSHFLARERWPPVTAGSVTYLTAQLVADRPSNPPRSEWRYPLDQRDRVWRNLNRWVEGRVGSLLPYAVSPDDGALTWDLLVDLRGGAGRERLGSQFWTSCWNPSDRHVMSVPGSVRSRLLSAGTGYANLVMAGDWTLTALSVGCIEAAVMSGMHAARVLCGHPGRIVGDDLPDGDEPAPETPGR